MDKPTQLYSEVASSSGNDTNRSMSPTLSAKLAKHGLVNWLKDYQEEDEHVTLEKAIYLSKVR